ncbi:MAG: hypothetical protein JWQ57_573 [Mucilaginibacter sp.]|nr:hypothetical protein [Mucilaginibacter sp.]
MKKSIIILSALVIVVLGMVALAGNKKQVPVDEFSAYIGRFQHKFGGASPYVDLYVEDGKFFGINSWDSSRRDLEYLNRDNFIVKGFGWAIRFIRNKDQQVNTVNISGYGDWLRINKDSSMAASAKWMQAIQDSKSRPFHMDSADLKLFTGNYGEKQIVLQNGQLYFITSTNYKTPLTPLAENTFTYDVCKMQFYKDKNETVTELAILYENGFEERYKRGK